MYEKKTLISIAIAVFIGAFTIAIMILMRDFQTSPQDSSSVIDSSSVSETSAADSSSNESAEATTMTTAQATEPAEEYVEYTFRTKSQFDGHYKKHGKEFGNITQEEYLKKANDLINNKSDTILHKTEAEDGDYIYYDTVNNEILFLSAKGYIRTYFKPNRGIDYYNDQ